MLHYRWMYFRWCKALNWVGKLAVLHRKWLEIAVRFWLILLCWSKEIVGLLFISDCHWSQEEDVPFYPELSCLMPMTDEEKAFQGLTKVVYPYARQQKKSKICTHFTLLVKSFYTPTTSSPRQGKEMEAFCLKEHIKIWDLSNRPSCTKTAENILHNFSTSHLGFWKLTPNATVDVLHLWVASWSIVQFSLSSLLVGKMK